MTRPDIAAIRRRLLPAIQALRFDTSTLQWVLTQAHESAISGDLGAAKVDVPALCARVEELEAALTELADGFAEQSCGDDCEPAEDWCECGREDVLRAIATVLYGPPTADPAPGVKP